MRLVTNGGAALDGDGVDHRLDVINSNFARDENVHQRLVKIQFNYVTRLGGEFGTSSSLENAVVHDTLPPFIRCMLKLAFKLMPASYLLL